MPGGSGARTASGRAVVLQMQLILTQLDVEVHDDGQLSLFCGGASNLGPDDAAYINDMLIIALTRCLIALAGKLGQTAGYGGRWMLAVGIDELQGKTSAGSSTGMRLGPDYSAFSAPTYTCGTEVVTVELLEQPGAVTRRLLARLLRALDRQHGPQPMQLLADED